LTIKNKNSAFQNRTNDQAQKEKNIHMPKELVSQINKAMLTTHAT